MTTTPIIDRKSKPAGTPEPRAVRVLAIVGPTAVGKSAVAEEVAVRIGAEIVSADSMQVYRGMDIGTAKLPVNERRVPYHCLDLVEPGQPYSAALFQRDARAAIERIAAGGALPVVCGGTGMYVRSALDDWRFPAGEQVDNPVRQRWDAYLAAHGPQALHDELVRRDAPSAALVHPNNSRRVIRALELHELGESYAEHNAGFDVRESVYDTVFVGLTMERPRLYERIDARVDAMIEAGLVGEVETLLGRGLHDALTAAQAIGYKELVPVVEDGAPLDGAVAAIKQASRRYAKRQLTWFRADQRVRWLDVTDLSLERAVNDVLAALD